MVSKDHRALLGHLREAAATQDITYTERGQTASAHLPAGYRHDRLDAVIGQGAVAWSRARDAITGWFAHRRAGINVTPGDASIETGNTVVVSRSFGPVLIAAPCRIVSTTATPTRFGFAYGTLPGHPETGEEAFHVDLDADGAVHAHIVAFSRPADLSTRLAGPLARQIQRAATRRYLAGIVAYAQNGE